MDRNREILEGIYFPQPAFDMQDERDLVQDFVKSFRTKHGHDPDIYAAYDRASRHEFVRFDTSLDEIADGDPRFETLDRAVDASGASLVASGNPEPVKDEIAYAERAEALGGEVLLGPDPELRDGTIALVVDPTGAVLALQQMKP